MSNFYEQLCQTFIRPPRQIYNIYDLGQPIRKYGKRIDFYVYNTRHHKLLCSYFNNNINPLAPCVLYLHSLNGSRLESLPFIDLILAKQLNFCSFDFSGSGLSQGQYVSLGFYQKYDIKVVLDQLSNKFTIKNFYFWGRSMGAAAAIKYLSMISTQKPPSPQYSIDGLILDSPFTSLSQLTIKLIKQKTSIPQFFIRAMLLILQSTVQKKAGFKISSMELLPDIKYIKCPIFIITSTDDTLVPAAHSERIYQNIGHKDREILFIKGQHNQNRQPDTVYHIVNFIFKDIGKRKKISKTSLAKSTKLIPFTPNFFSDSHQNPLLISKSTKKIHNNNHNISNQAFKFDTTRDQQCTHVKPDDEIQEKQYVNKQQDKQYKKALHLYTPKITRNSQKKTQFKKFDTSFKMSKNKQFSQLPKQSIQRNLSQNLTKPKFNQTQIHQSEKHILPNHKQDFLNLSYNHSSTQDLSHPQPIHHKYSLQTNQRIPPPLLTPQKPSQDKFKTLTKVSLIQSDLKSLQSKNQISQRTHTKIHSNFQVNHLNIITQKLKKKKKHSPLRYLSPNPHLHQQQPFSQYLQTNLQYQTSHLLNTKTPPSILKVKLKPDNLNICQSYNQ